MLPFWTRTKNQQLKRITHSLRCVGQLAITNTHAYLLGMDVFISVAAQMRLFSTAQDHCFDGLMGRPKRGITTFFARCLMLVFGGFLMASSVSPTFAQSTPTANPLADLRGEKRIVLLFSKSRSDATLDKQVDLLRARRRDLSDRDTVVLVVEGRSDVVSAIGYVDVPRGAALDLRKLYEKERVRFFGILIGKDGLEKSRWQRVRDPQDMFDQIDAMPMRQQEIRNTETN